MCISNSSAATGALVAHEGKRVVPEVQVTDRGEVSLDTADLVRKQQRTRQAISQLTDVVDVTAEERNDRGRYEPFESAYRLLYSASASKSVPARPSPSKSNASGWSVIAGLLRLL